MQSVDQKILILAIHRRNQVENPLDSLGGNPLEHLSGATPGTTPRASVCAKVFTAQGELFASVLQYMHVSFQTG